MTLQIRDATPADAMLLNALGYRTHFEQKALSFAYMSTEITGVRFVLMSDVVSLNLRIPL
jgi:hypothetical protein